MRNSGRPWPSSVVTVVSQSGPEPALKLATVVGSSSSEEAKIGGMTPEVLSLSGRCEDWPSNMRLPTWRLGYWISSRRWARSMNTMKAIDRDHHDDDREDEAGRQRALTAEFERAGDRRRQARDDARQDDQRNAVADAARGDLLAEPHQEHGAAGERDDRRDAEEPARDRLTTLPEPSSPMAMP